MDEKNRTLKLHGEHIDKMISQFRWNTFLAEIKRGYLKI